MSKPLVSVIMPVKNGGIFFKACLESFILQKSETIEFELLVVNDHSTDESETIAQEYESNYSSITLLQNEGNGIVDALQTGWKSAKGELISRMDADDLMPPAKFDHLFEALLSSENTLATGHASYFASGKALGEGYKRYEHWLNSLCLTDSHYNHIYTECPVASPNWLIRREDFEKVGGFGVGYPEDYDFVFRCRHGGLKIASSKQVTHLWRDHDSRASRNDDHYSDNSFLNLKGQWFLKSDYELNRTLVLVGSGKKGKRLARQFEKEKTNFVWLTNNQKKVGLKIGESELVDYESWAFKKDQQVICAIASPAEKASLNHRLEQLGLKQGSHYFPFC
jgi:glycosyltransferase involved in cell wall biosynthesis